MSSVSSLRIRNTTEKALEQVRSRIKGLKDGYLIILQTMIIAQEDNISLKFDLESFKKNLGSTDIAPEQYFLSILFLDLISEVELFFTHLLKAIATEYPKCLSSRSFKLSEILDAGSTDDLITRAADEYLNDLMYKKPSEYLRSMCQILSIDQDNLIEPWKNYVEAKARRDLGVHNRWICNSTYLRKLREASIPTTASEGESLLPSYKNYVMNLLVELDSLISQIAKDVIKKHSK